MKISTCPTCGRRGLRAATGPVTFTFRGKKRTIARVPHLHCSSCGERLFDRESNRVLDAHRGGRRSRGAA